MVWVSIALPDEYRIIRVSDRTPVFSGGDDIMSKE